MSENPTQETAQQMRTRRYEHTQHRREAARQRREHQKALRDHRRRVKNTWQGEHEYVGVQNTGFVWSVLVWVVDFGMMIYISGLFAGVGDYRWLLIVLLAIVFAVVLGLIEHLLPPMVVLILNTIGIILFVVLLVFVLFPLMYSTL